MSEYKRQYQEALADLSTYRLTASADVHWFQPPSKGVNTSDSPFNRYITRSLRSLGFAQENS